jgi:hypothetical protein
MAMLMDVDVLVCVVVTLAMATVFMLLRMLARRMTRVALWWDDALAAFAYVGLGSRSGGTMYSAKKRLICHVRLLRLPGLPLYSTVSAMLASCFQSHFPRFNL